ncbi:MAG: DUF3047 domain-containing protein [Alphaproteobacteria bacterium]|nr:DUF3047 domain-containing protein [Alphaproteobacteria bacterium]
MKKHIVIAAVLLVLAACASGPSGNAPAPAQATRASVVDGTIRLLDRIPGAQSNPAPEQWWTRRQANEGPLTVVDLQGTLAIRPDAPGGSIMARRVDASLAATPFLRWSWYLEPSVFGGGPGTGQERGLRMVVFFRSVDRPFSERLASWAFVEPAEYDHWVEISFGGFGAARAEMAQQRKWTADESGRRIVLREPRAEQAGNWHVEAIDLNELYKRFWPSGDPAKMRIVMVGLGGFSGPVPDGVPGAIGYISEAYLTR